MLDGILPIDKPQGWTSHDVVARVRRLAGQRQVGHAGTLDPLATGLLILVLGSATRLSSYLMEASKTYCAEVVLGTRTNTDDAEGVIVGQGDASGVSREDVEGVLSRFVGEISQVPPAYAAVKHKGQRLYTLARKGIEVEPEPRSVTIHHLQVLAFAPPRVRLVVECGSGTYIRSLARDLGGSLGTGAYLHALRRVRSGAFGIDDTCTLTRLAEDGVQSHLRRPDLAVHNLPATVVQGEDVRKVLHGGPAPLTELTTSHIRLYDEAGRLLALGAPHRDIVKPFLVFPGPA